MSTFKTYKTPAGNVVNSREPPTEAEMAEIDAMIAQGGFDDEEPWEDPDADGYGWERKALRGI